MGAAVTSAACGVHLGYHFREDNEGTLAVDTCGLDSSFLFLFGVGGF